MKESIHFLGLFLLANILAADSPAQDGPWCFESVRQLAARTVKTGFVPDEELPRNIQDLTYDELRSIRFSPRESVWRMEHLPFQLQFFHPGGIQKDRIAVNLVEGEVVAPVEFSRDMFEYQGVNIRGRISDGVGFSGFRVHYPLNKPDYLDELIVFQGASYFRALAQKCFYGASARALGLQVAEGKFEEFPRFRKFWVEKPGRESKHLRLWALVESESVVGAYEFTIRPGADTVMDVRGAVFFRKSVRVPGIAPITSMFWYGENTPYKFGDFRPEVHDSDGALIHTGDGEWLWRPLSNDTNCFRWSSFSDRNTRGFGLFQRDRRFGSYEDLEANYHARPSVWIEPSTNACWDKGDVRLVELPSTTEYGDNVNLFYVPDMAVPEGGSMEFDYRMHWFAEKPEWPPLGRTISTRLADISYNRKAVRFILEFSKPAGGPEINPADIRIDLAADRGRILGSFFQLNNYENTWRTILDIEAAAADTPVELRCTLRTDQGPLTETWAYQWICRNF